jgi:hypothetical protein
MTDHADNPEREETIRDLDVPEGKAGTVKGGGLRIPKPSGVSDLLVTKRIDAASSGLH